MFLKNFKFWSKKPKVDNIDVLSNNKSQDPNHITNGKIKDFEEAIPFAEALEKTKFGLINYFIIITSGVVLANVLLETSAVAFYMPVAHCDLHLTNYRKGLLSCIGYVGMIISSHLWGFLADTKGRRRVIRPTLIIGFVVTLFSSFATNFWIMLFLRFVNGIFVSGSSATIYAYLGEFHIDRTRSRAMMISSFIFALGAMLMPFISFMVINQDWSFPLEFLGITYKPWRLFVIVCGLPGFLAGVSMYFLPESPKFLLSIHEEEKAIKVLHKMYKVNGGKGELKITHIIPEEDCDEVLTIENKNMNFFLKLLLNMWNQTVPLFRPKYLRSTLIVCTTQFWLYVITNGLYMWFPYIINAMGEYMRNNPDGNEKLCNIVYAKHDNQTEGIMDCPDKLEPTTYMYSLLMEILYASSFAVIGVIINLVCIVFFSSCGLVAVWLPYTSVAAIFYVLLFLVGVCINVLGGATVEIFPTQLRAMAMCVSLMMGRIGSVVGTNIVGALLATYCEITFYISCFALMSCAILILFLPHHVMSRNSKKSNIQDT
ncbi:Synaptic vesicle glycoprotein 2B [Lucilia cuprina]|nr:Synaptic vesicle glycoprotein 2B [Lucilia cuprina]